MRALTPLLFLAALISSPAVAAEPPPLGVTWSGWRGAFAKHEQPIARFRAAGFRLISLVPAYAYVDKDLIDLATAPTPEELADAIVAAWRSGADVILKPHLEPPLYSPGFDPFMSDNASWRANCSWRGFFDVDPISPAYRDGVVFAGLRALALAFDRAGDSARGPVRFELGTELMNAVVAAPARWGRLLSDARRERKRLKLDGRVLLSHNFTHHIEIPDDFVGRMTPADRRALGAYIARLDAIALSQYMDLTITVPPNQRDKRTPTPDEVAEALIRHERTFRASILTDALGIPAARIPPLHIGEFGVGRGGLRHPNLYAGATTPADDARLAREVTAGHEGLLRYLRRDDRTARSAVLWVTGRFYDVFGWANPAYGVPTAATAIRAAMTTAN